MNEAPIYSRGLALTGCFESRASPFQIDGVHHTKHKEGRERIFEAGTLTTETVTRFTGQWGSALVREGRRIDDQLDTLLIDATSHEWGWLAKAKPIKETLDLLLKRREGLRAFEQDVEQFAENVAGMWGNSAPAVAASLSAVTQVLNEVHGTYERCFELCVLKTSTISGYRVALTNISLATIAVVVALASLYASS